MNLIKKHKFTTFIVLMYIILIVFAFFVNKLFFSSSGVPNYDDRLDGVESVAIKDEQYANMKKELEEEDSVVSVSSNLNGLTVNVTITVEDGVTKKNAKTIGKKVLGYFDKEQLAYYDIQVFMNKTAEEQDDFPIIGYKHNEKSSLVWSRDRQVSE